ncbi:hypothetical protein OESDEN_03297 [Oesophagostomum dentatum]|uniref:Rho-GAP domain-containing protein n=1 Tax=Oesophagostomum dentatum TaxID=61180 RepID=A0A0B1TGS7_OESDE|nr:hypothetical protein OESDEN_03297 [Oesophagostomum dentatum]
METMPAAHLRTAAYLMRHLSRLCSYTSLTDMTAKNLAIVWAPNLFRAPPMLDGGDSHLLNGLDVHTSLCSYLIINSGSIFMQENGGATSILAAVEDERTSKRVSNPEGNNLGRLVIKKTV